MVAVDERDVEWFRDFAGMYIFIGISTCSEWAEKKQSDFIVCFLSFFCCVETRWAGGRRASVGTIDRATAPATKAAQGRQRVYEAAGRATAVSDATTRTTRLFRRRTDRQNDGVIERAPNLI